MAFNSALVDMGIWTIPVDFCGPFGVMEACEGLEISFLAGCVRPRKAGRARALSTFLLKSKVPAVDVSFGNGWVDNVVFFLGFSA
jgi:hypothetical protein